MEVRTLCASFSASGFDRPKDELDILPMSHMTPILRRSRRGFTLIESAMAMVIIGVAVGAMLQLIAAGTQVNIAGSELATAINLGKNIKEFSQTLTYKDATGATTRPSSIGLSSDIWDMDGFTVSPPVDCTGRQLDNYGSWSQNITVQTVNPAQVASTRPTDQTVGLARITVSISHAGHFVSKTSWLVSNRTSGN